jgi:hypothetical protein
MRRSEAVRGSHMNRIVFGAILSGVALVGVSCGEGLENTPAETVAAGEVATTSEALSINGMTVNWHLIGSPSQASKIAACTGGVVYALNNDAALYKGDGSDSKWVYQGKPWAARDIGCTESSPTWIWAFNNDKKFYYNVYSGNDAKWVYEGTAGGAIQMGNGGMLSALNGDGTVWTYDNATKAWTHRATFTGATEASGARVGSTGKYRWFVVKNGDVQFTDGTSSVLTAFPIKTLLPFPSGTKLAVRDVSAVSSDEVWALTESRKLYKATFIETACKDGKDNDVDSGPDGFDRDCFEPLGKEVCAAFNKTGTFCIDRIGVPSNTLARCNGSTLVTTQTGNWCTHVGAGGADTVGIIH